MKKHLLRIAVILLSAALLLGLAACGSGETAESSDPMEAKDVAVSPSPSTSPSTSPSPSPTPKATAKPTAKPTATPAPAPTEEPEEQDTYSEDDYEEDYDTQTVEPTAAPTAAPTPAPTPEPEPEPEPDPAPEASPYDYIGSNINAFYAVFGYPSASEYASSCLGEGEDGFLYYGSFTVYTYRENGVETIVDVA